MLKKLFNNPLIILLFSFISMILHNLVYGIFHFEEPVFFILTFIFFVLFLASLINFIFRKLK